MAIPKPYLGPRSDTDEGAKDRRRYQAFKLPETWTNSRLESPGKWIGPDEYFWTPDTFFDVFPSMTPELLREIRDKTGGCFYGLSLTEQCALLGVKYDRAHPADMADVCANPSLDASSSVEAFSLDFYRNQGYAGDLGEGASICLLAHVLRKRLEAKNIKFHKLWYPAMDKSVFPGGIYQRHKIAPHERDVIRDEVEWVLRPSNRAALYKLWSGDPREFPLRRQLNVKTFPKDHFHAVCEGLTDDRLISIAELNLMGYGGGGWPDLTLQKDGVLKFVEVKQGGDKFTHRQAYWIRNFAIPLKLDFKVLHVVPSIKVGLRARSAAKTT
jgi:hypothetical protein